MASPKLSVILPNYNHARFLPGALRAILDQSYRPLEIIVIDDCSTDNSVEIIERFAHDNPIIRFFRNERNRGGIYTANRARELATGEYIFTSAVDDRVLSGFFEQSMSVLVQHPEAGVCSALSAVMNESGRYKGIIHTPMISRIPCFVAPARAWHMLHRHGSWFMGNTAIYRKAALTEVGGLIPELGQYSDGFLHLVLTLKYGACFVPEPLAVWRKVRGSYSERMSGDVDAMLDITRTAKRLMESTYRDLFPAAYADDWKRRWQFVVCTNFVFSSQAAQLAGLQLLIQPHNLADRSFFSGLRFSMALQHLFTKLYLFGRLRRGHVWQEVARKARHLANRVTAPTLDLEQEQDSSNGQAGSHAPPGIHNDP